MNGTQSPLRGLSFSVRRPAIFLVNLAAEVEAAHATRTAEAAATPAGQPMRRVRDRAAARLHDLMRQVRDYGKHAFRKDPKLRTAFTSDQLRRRRRKSGSEQPAPQP